MSRFSRRSICCLSVGALAAVMLCHFSGIGLAQNGLAQNSKPKTPAAPVSRTAPAKHYVPGDLHLEKSHVFILVGKTGLGHEHGVVGNLKSGTIHLAGGREGDQIVFDMTSFDADSDEARKYVGLEGSTDASTREQVNANMLGEAVLNVDKFPTATFEIESVKKSSKMSKQKLPLYQINGKFTLHGTTKPITLVAEAEEKEKWTHLRGTFSILQSDYGIKPFSKAFGAVGVTDKLQIWGDLWVAGGSH